MINSYDIDGVINMGRGLTGLRPAENDIIITGRSVEDEREYTLKWLRTRGIRNHVHFNPMKFEQKTRQNSGEQKARILNAYWDMHIPVGIHFEDDPIQADIIERECPRVKVVRIVHDLVEKENVWHGPTTDQSSAGADS